MGLRIHSTGPLYATMNNIPRFLRLLRENTFLLCVLPCLREPSKEHMNSVPSLLEQEIQELQNDMMAFNI